MTANRQFLLTLPLLAFFLVLPRYLGEHHMHVMIQILLFAYLSSCWNILGGFAGQLSFGHAYYLADAISPTTRTRTRRLLPGR